MGQNPRENWILLITGGRTEIQSLETFSQNGVLTKADFVETCLRRGLRVRHVHEEGTIELEGNISGSYNGFNGDVWIFVFDEFPNHLEFDYDENHRVCEVTFG